MDKRELLARLMGTFLAELDENLRSFNRELLLLEKMPAGPERTESLTRLFRTAHSLKGAARSVNQSEIESLCHQLEDRLAALRDGHTELSPENISALFAGLDSIEQAAECLKPRAEAQTNQVETAKPSASHEPAPPASNGLVQVANATTEKVSPDVGPGAIAASQRRSFDGNVGPSVVGNDFAMVRVAAHKLDALLAWSGELLVARRRIADHTERLSGLQRTLRTYRTVEHHRDKATRLLQSSRIQKATRAADGDGGLHSTDNPLAQFRHDIEELSASFASDIRALEQAASPVEQEIRQIRMLPFAECCQGLDRLVRDLSQSSGKEVLLMIEGETVEVDRAVIEQLRDPLRHLVRNAMSHGIETREDRLAAGKPAEGHIKISAATRGGHVEISVSDDGRGLNLDAIRERAKDYLTHDVTSADIANTVFLPGVSTATQVDEVSGRGVGLDVVKSHVEALRGSITVSWIEGSGTTFFVTVPLTLTVMRALLLRVDNQIFAVSNAHIRKLLRFGPEKIHRPGNREMLVSEQGRAPTLVVPLRRVLGLADASETQRCLAVIVGAGENNVGLIVDEFLAEQDIIVKGLGRYIKRTRLISGATLLPSGEVALVINVPNVVRAALGSTPQRTSQITVNALPVKQRKRLIVADDSITTLSLEKSILEAAGYDVRVAVDGQKAWELLQAEDADLLVTDVEMPKLDGFGLTARIRACEQYHHLPIVLLTARESDADKARGLTLGANAYLVKSSFDQEHLLETVAQLL
ncbi:MAG TPA: response regulator [Candidatus Binataceae bacterium]|nr:response regulator [Candidatus Binataceae bacterium]